MVNWRVLLVFCVSSLIENGIKREGVNGDSIVREVLLIVLLSVLLLRSLLMLLEVDEMDMCNCDE